MRGRWCLSFTLFKSQDLSRIPNYIHLARVGDCYLFVESYIPVQVGLAIVAFSLLMI